MKFMSEKTWIYNSFVGFEVLTAASVKMAVFWAVAPCNLVQVTDVSEALAALIIRAMTHHRDEEGSRWLHVDRMQKTAMFINSLDCYRNGLTNTYSGSRQIMAAWTLFM
jgi:hypothetical protein